MTQSRKPDFCLFPVPQDLNVTNGFKPLSAQGQDKLLLVRPEHPKPLGKLPVLEIF